MAQSISLAGSGAGSAPVAAAVAARGLCVAVEMGDLAVLEGLAGEWRELAAAEPQTRPTQMPEWIAAYLRHLEPNAEVVVITALRDGRLRALLPLVSEPQVETRGSLDEVPPARRPRGQSRH